MSVTQSEKREHQRFRVAILAHICEQTGGEPLRCLIRDVSLSGCRVVSRHLPYLSGLVSIQMPHITEVLDGRIVWRRDNVAGIEFIWGSAGGRRDRMRRSLNIMVCVHDPADHRLLLQATVTDASNDSCRLESDGIDQLPDEVRVKVPGLIEPVKARVAWRKSHAVGIEFHWKDRYQLIKP